MPQNTLIINDSLINNGSNITLSTVPGAGLMGAEALLRGLMGWENTAQQTLMGSLEQDLRQLENSSQDEDELVPVRSTAALDVTQRRLFSNHANVTVKNTIPTQLIRFGEPYTLTIDPSEIFEGNFSYATVSTIDGEPWPAWLQTGPVLRGFYDTPGSAYDVIVQNGLAFVADGSSGLQIINISDPSNPTLTETYSTPGSAYDVTLQDNLAFVADYGSGLQIVDVSDPSNPTFRGSYDTVLKAQGVALQNSLAFVVDIDLGLHIVDVSDPSNPTLRGSYNTPGYTRGIALQNSLAFVADYDSLQIIDVSDPDNPTLRGFYNEPEGSVYDVALQNSLAFLAGGSSGLRIIDISDPGNPTLIESYSTPGNARDIALQNNLAFVADSSAGLQIIDVHDPSNPTLMGSYNTPGTAYDVTLQNSLVFVADSSSLQIMDFAHVLLSGTSLVLDIGDHTLQLFVQDISGVVLASTEFNMIVASFPRPADNTLSEQSLLPGETLTLDLNAGALFSDNNGDFLTLTMTLFQRDIPLTLKPDLRGSYGTPGSARSVTVQNNLAFVADYGSGLQIIDVSYPGNPTFRGSYDTLGSAYDVALQNSLAFLASGSAGLHIIDVSDPINPVLRDAYNTPGSVRSVIVQNNLAFMADGNSGLQILDVSNSRNPTPRGFYDTPGYAYNVILQNSLAFVADGSSGLQIIDVSDPSDPVLRGAYNISGSAYDVALQNNLAIMVDYDSNLHIIDVSDPSNPTRRGSYDLPEYARSVTVQNSLVFVADESSGVQIIDISDPGNPTLRGSYNTPGSARGISVQNSLAYVADYDVGLLIIDLTRWEFKFTANTSDVGNHEVVLTATNAQGSSGTDSFILRIEGPPVYNGQIGQLYFKVGRARSYFVPQGLVTDPNLDPITFTAHNKDEVGLLPWLNVNSISGIFSGTPSSEHVGNYTITLGAQDNNQKTSQMITEQDFFIYVDHVPQLATSILDQQIDLGRDAVFSLVSSSGNQTIHHYFVEPDGDALFYVLSTEVPVPTWLKFREDSAEFFINASTMSSPASYRTTLIASDPYGGSIKTSFDFVVGYFPPVLNQALSNQVATVGSHYSFSVPRDTFYDPNNPELEHQARQTTGEALPDWLTFNAKDLSFSGEPGRGDTNTFADRILVIRFKGSDGVGSAFTDFDLNVKGSSWIESALRVGLPFLSFCTTVFALYRKRSLFLNRRNRDKYQKVMEQIQTGEQFEYTLDTPKEFVYKLQAKRPRLLGNCSRLFFSPRQPLHGGFQLPYWMEYDSSTNTLRSKGPVPDNIQTETLTIQIKDHANIIQEQFDLRIQGAESEQDAADNQTADIEMAGIRRMTG